MDPEYQNKKQLVLFTILLFVVIIYNSFLHIIIEKQSQIEVKIIEIV